MNKTIKKEIHNIHDKSYKDLYSKKEIAINLFKNHIKSDWIKAIRAEDLKLVNKSFVTSDYEDRECDIVYEAKINETKVIFYVLLEFQSTIDYTMPLRLLIYITEILRDHAKNAEHKKYDKNLKIPAVVPLVLYNGESKWDVEQEFRKIIDNEEIFGEGLINFKYDLFDVNNSFTKAELIDSKNVTSAIFLLDQKIDEIEFLERIKVIALYFNNLNDNELIALKHWIKNTVQDQLADSAIEILESKKEDVENMVANNAFILTEMKEKAMQEGMQQGVQQGMQQGLEKKEIEIVLNMLSEGLNEEMISKLTKIDINKVRDIKTKYKS